MALPRRCRASPGAVFGFFLALYVLTMRGSLGGGGDEEVPYRMTESLVTRGTLAVPPDTKDRWPEAVLQAQNGRFYAAFGIGQSLAAVPFYLLGRAVAGGEAQTRPIRVWFVTLLNPFVAALTCAILYRLVLRSGYAPSTALLVTFLYGLGTMIWPYAKTFLSEPLSGLCLLGAMYGIQGGTAGVSSIRPSFPQPEWEGGRGAAADGGADRRPLLARILLAGWAAGGAVLVRPFLGIAVPLLGWYLHMRWKGASPALKKAGKGGALSVHAAFAGPVLLALLFVLGYNVYRYGQWWEFGYGPEVSGAWTWRLWPGLYGHLFSPGKSLFLYMPVLLLFFWGIGPFWRSHRPEAWLCLALGVETLLFYSARQVWWGNWCWGPRYFVPVLPFLILPVAAAWERYRTKRFRLSVAGLFGASLVMQLMGVLVYNGLYIDWMVHVQGLPMAALLDQPAFSPLVGHWVLARQGWIDLWWVQLARLDWVLALGWGSLPLLLLTVSAWRLGRNGWSSGEESGNALEAA